MEAAFKSKMIMFFLLTLWVLIPVTRAGSAGSFHNNIGPSEAPQFVSLTGVLFPSGEEAEKATGIDKLTVLAEEKEWVFVVENARNLSGLEPARTILRDLFSSTLRLWGSKKLITSLEKPEDTGKLITIEGYIHVANNIMEVTSVKGLS